VTVPSAPAGSSAPNDGWADAIVIGTGFGGAITACRIAQAGLRVVVLERGRRYEAKDFPSLPADSDLAPEFRRWAWSNDHGLWDIVDLEEIVSVQAAGYGGGSLIYANVHLRPAPGVFDARWPQVYQRGACLTPYFDLAASMLGVAPVTDAPAAFQKSLVKADQLHQAMRSLRRDSGFFHPPLAVTYEPVESNGFGRAQKACTSCGACCTGCPETAKNTLDFNYLANAEARGAEVKLLHEVETVEEVSGRGWAAHCIDHLTDRRMVFHTKHLFLCAGSVHSTRLLARIKLHTPRPFQSQVGVGYFPGGDALGMVYETKHPQYPSHGPTITTTTVHWENPNDASYFLIQDGGYAEALQRLLGILRAPAWVGRNRLTHPGAASVARTPGPPPPHAAKPTSGLILRSPLDDVLDAISEGDFQGIGSELLHRSMSEVLSMAKAPLLFPEVVDRTIDNAIRQQDKACWLTRHADPDGWFLRCKRVLVKKLVHWFFGSNDKLADYAIRALTSFAGLPRQDVAKLVLGYDAEGGDRRTMLLAMGRDASAGVLEYDAKTDRLIADLDLFHLAPGYTRQERLMSDVAGALGGELRTNPAWAFLGRPITVHNQGGCAMSDLPADGVVDPFGEVHGCPGLYVFDGAALCTSVGVNPSATIAAITERNVFEFLRRTVPSWPNVDAPGAREYAQQVDRAKKWADRAQSKGWTLAPPQQPSPGFESQPLGLKFHENMKGYVSPASVDPTHHDATYAQHETAGRPNGFVEIDLHVKTEDLSVFFEDETHTLQVSGEVTLPGEPKPLPVSGTLQLFVARYKRHAIGPDPARKNAHERLLGPRRSYRTIRGDPPSGGARYLDYRLAFDGKPGWSLRGYKRVTKQPALDAWRDTSTLFTWIERPGASAPMLAGVAHVELDNFLFKQLSSIEVTGTKDPARITWATATFGAFFFGSLQRIYLPAIDTVLQSLLRRPSGGVHYKPPRV